MKELIVKGVDIKYKTFNENDYICLTDIAKIQIRRTRRAYR